MATRSTVHFINSDRHDDHHHQCYIVYVHHDGYPSHRGNQLLEFLRVCNEDIVDSRLHDAGRTAARFVGYMFDDYHQRAVEHNWTDKHPLGAIAISLCNEDPGDIEYRYIVDCGDPDDDGLPSVKVQNVNMAILNMSGSNQYEDAKPLREVLEKNDW